MTSVAILMTTFNGEKYISEQIESIISQTFKNWTLFIRDDNSTDATQKILSKYADLDSRIKLVSNTEELHGAYFNFFYLIEYTRKQAKFDYYFFCDQDDLWIEKKIEISLQQFNNDGKPELVYSDMSTIDEKNEIIEKSINDILGIQLKNVNQLFFVHAYIWGCTVSFNYKLFEMVPSIEIKKDSRYVEQLSHDNFFAKFALEYGSVHFCDEQLVLYRRHGGNVTQSHQFKLSPLSVVRKALFELDSLAKTHARVYNQTLYMIKKVETQGKLSPRLLEIRTVIHSGGVKGLRYLIKQRISRKQFSRTFGLYLVMLSQKYKKYIKEELQ